jgi:hypothetical protein
MAKSLSVSFARRFPTWWHQYEAAVHEIRSSRLFECIEIAESTILIRRDAIVKGAHLAERRHISHALVLLALLKKYHLGFG